MKRIACPEIGDTLHKDGDRYSLDDYIDAVYDFDSETWQLTYREGYSDIFKWDSEAYGWVCVS